MHEADVTGLPKSPANNCSTSAPNPNAVPPLRVSFSAANVPGGFDAWRETFGLRIARVDVRTPDPAHFYADMRVRPLPAVVLTQNHFGACSVMRTPELLHDGDDAVDMVICLEGRFDVRFGDDAAVLLPGQAALLPHHRAGGCHVQAGSRSCVLRVDRSVARQLTPDLDAALVRATAPGDPTAAILRAYCSELVTAPGELPAATASLAGAQLKELMAHLLGSQNAIEIAGRSGFRAARLRAIKDDIAKLLERPDLSVGTIAALHRCTPRYVQILFENEGTTFTEYVLAQRLARAHRLLTDPRHAHEKISNVAFEAGFTTLSYFNRVFRHRYGASPSDLRAAAQRQ
jgi:AraC-like DNA-binding protein